MSHEIETIAFDGQVPWHGLGFPVTDLNPQEMLRAAQLDWSVSKRPIFTAESPNFNTQPTAYTLPFPGLFALVRDSDNRVLGPCGPQYLPFQNSEVFDFFNRFTEAGHMKMEVAGSLKGGTWIWALAKISDGAFNLMGDDPNYSYLLLSSPHVWGEAMTIMFTSVRVVCWNTITLALGKKVVDKFRYIHNKSFGEIASSATLAVEQAMVEKAVLESKAKILAEAKVRDLETVYKYYGQLILNKSAVEIEEVEMADLKQNRTLRYMADNYFAGPGAKLQSANGTWWGAFNGVTRFVDFQKGRSGRDVALYNAWLAHTDAVLKRKALDLAVQYAQAAEEGGAWQSTRSLF